MITQEIRDTVESFVTMAKLVGDSTLYILDGYSSEKQKAFGIVRAYGHVHHSTIAFTYSEDEIVVDFQLEVGRDFDMIYIMMHEVKEKNISDVEGYGSRFYKYKFVEFSKFEQFFNEVIVKNIHNMFWGVGASV